MDRERIDRLTTGVEEWLALGASSRRRALAASLLAVIDVVVPNWLAAAKRKERKRTNGVETSGKSKRKGKKNRKKGKRKRRRDEQRPEWDCLSTCGTCTTCQNRTCVPVPGDQDVIFTQSPTPLDCPTPYRSAIGPDGRVFVTDMLRSRIVVYRSAPDNSGGVWAPLVSFGTQGSGLGQLDRPHYTFVAPDGRVYVADTGNDRISVWQESGGSWHNVATFGAPGEGTEDLAAPRGLFVDASGTAFVGDPGHGRLTVWQQSGGSWDFVAALYRYFVEALIRWWKTSG